MSDTYTYRDLDNMTTAAHQAAAVIKQHTFCSSITSANFEGGGSRLVLIKMTQVGSQKTGKTEYYEGFLHSYAVWVGTSQDCKRSVRVFRHLIANPLGTVKTKKKAKQRKVK